MGNNETPTWESLLQCIQRPHGGVPKHDHLAGMAYGALQRLLQLSPCLLPQQLAAAVNSVEMDAQRMRQASGQGRAGLG